MEILTWAIVAIGVLVGGLFMMFGFRKTDHKPVLRSPSGFWSRKLE